MLISVEARSRYVLTTLWSSVLVLSTLAFSQRYVLTTVVQMHGWNINSVLMCRTRVQAGNLRIHFRIFLIYLFEIQVNRVALDLGPRFDQPTPSTRGKCDIFSVSNKEPVSPPLSQTPKSQYLHHNILCRCEMNWSVSSSGVCSGTKAKASVSAHPMRLGSREGEVPGVVCQ
jgi:hypothetical protein